MWQSFSYAEIQERFTESLYEMYCVLLAIPTRMCWVIWMVTAMKQHDVIVGAASELNEILLLLLLQRNQNAVANIV